MMSVLRIFAVWTSVSSEFSIGAASVRAPAKCIVQVTYEILLYFHCQTRKVPCGFEVSTPARHVGGVGFCVWPTILLRNQSQSLLTCNIINLWHALINGMKISNVQLKHRSNHDNVVAAGPVFRNNRIMK